MRLLYLLPIILLASCSRKAAVTKTEYVRDSTAERELRTRATLAESTLKELKESIKDSMGTTVIFEQLPGDTIYMPGRVTVDKSGAIVAEGRIKSLTVARTKDQQTIETLATELEQVRDSLETARTTVHIREVVKERQVKSTFIPWWIWVLLAVVGAAAVFKERIPFIKHFKI
jgi:hypothetical protein